MVARILVVDDSRTFSALVTHAVEGSLRLPVSVAGSLAEAGRILGDCDGQDVLVMSGLSLPDGREVEVVRFFTERGLPLVVVTGMFDEALRDRILAMPVLDYVPKDSPSCIDTLLSIIRRLERHRAATVLVVDDSASMRQQVVACLGLEGFRVIEAADGQQGLDALAANPDISLVITDFDMPRLDGVEMARRMRATRTRDTLAIIGLSGSATSGRGTLSARFLKSGADDFLAKPFLREELICRVAHNLEILTMMSRLRDMATKDFLTGLANRRHFFERAEPIFAQARRAGSALAVAMLDIDHFKRINDGWGHDAGDAALKAVAATLAGCVRPGHLLARFGGEEFCLLVRDMPPGDLPGFFEDVRARVASTTVEFDGAIIPVTTSIGVCTRPADSLDALLTEADQALYRAKTLGRNRVEGA